MCEHTSIFMKRRCRKSCCYNNADCCKKADCILTDVISGSIYLNDNCYNVLWQGVDIDATITIKVENCSDCLIKLVIIGKRHNIIKIFPHQQTNITVKNIHKLIVQRNCNVQNNCGCKICYDIGIHYISDFQSSNQNKETRYCHSNECVEWLPISCICSAFM